MHGRLHSASSAWCGGRRLLRSCGQRQPQRVGDDTYNWWSTHGFRHSSERSGRIRSEQMGEKMEYKDESLEHAFMGCSRARWRSSSEGRRNGRRGGEEGGLQGACTRSSRRPSVRCSSGCSLPMLGLCVQHRPHRPLFPLAHRAVSGQRSILCKIIEVEVNGVRQRSEVFIKRPAAAWIRCHRCLQPLLPGLPYCIVNSMSLMNQRAWLYFWGHHVNWWW